MATTSVKPKDLHLSNSLQCPGLASSQSSCWKYSLFETYLWKLSCGLCVCVQIWLLSVVTKRNSAWKSPSVHTVPWRTGMAFLGRGDLCIPRPSGEESSLASQNFGWFNIKQQWTHNKESLTPFSPVMCHGLLGRGYKLLSSVLVLGEISWLVGNQSLWILIAAPAEVITSNINNPAHLPVEFSVMLKVRLTPQCSWGLFCFVLFSISFTIYFLNFFQHWCNWNVTLSTPLYLCLLTQVINMSLLISVRLSPRFCVHMGAGVDSSCQS